jgi:nucleoside phosphorylase
MSQEGLMQLTETDIAIIAPTGIEWLGILEQMKDVAPVEDVPLPMKIGTIGTHTVLCCACGKGQQEAATAATLVLERSKPGWILLVGMAGGFPSQGVSRGDVVVAHTIHSFDYGKLVDGSFKRRPENDINCDRKLLAWAEVVAVERHQPWRASVSESRPDRQDPQSFKVHVDCYVASSDKVVDDPEHVAYAKVAEAFPEIHAVEMEGIGAGASTRLAQSERAVNFLMIRGISDEPGSGLGKAERLEWRKYAIATAAAFTRALIEAIPVKKKRLAWLIEYSATNAAPAPFTPAWFVFTQRSIPLIGREGELQALRTFFDSAPLFAWWALCGSGGVGKSRLAWEAALQLPDIWNRGFVDLGNPASIGHECGNLSRPTLLIIDDAARFPENVRTLLNLCCGQAPSISRKLRLLLIEREAGPKALWWSQLVGDYGAEGNLFQQYQYDPPLNVNPPQDLERQITMAWIEAGAPSAASRVPAAADGFWAKVKQLTGGTPLLLGVLAAAIARSSKAPKMSSEDLLAPILRREIERWRHAAPENDRFKATVALIATGTILGGLPFPTKYDVLFLNTPDGSVVLMEGKEGSRLPTFSDLDRLPGTIAERVADHLEAALAHLRTLPGVQDLEGSLETVRSLCPRAALRPDIIGTFFLSNLFRRRYSYESLYEFPTLDTAALQRLLLVALRIALSQAAENLNRLRLEISAPVPFARLLELLTVELLAETDDRISDAERSVVSFLLFNSLLMIGGQRPANDVFDVIFGALKRLFVRFPEDANVAYRYFKALPSLGLRREGEARLAAYREMLDFVPKVLPSLELNAAVSLADALFILARDTKLTAGEATLPRLMDAAVLLAAKFPANAELLEILSRIYFQLSVAISRPDLPDNDTPPDIVTEGPAIASCLDRAVSRMYTESQPAISSAAASNLVRVMVNLSMAFRKLGDFESAAAVGAKIQQMADRLPDDETTREMRIKTYYNALPGQLAGPTLDAALESLNRSRVLLPKGAGEADSTFLGIVEGVLGAALARGNLATFEEQCLAFAQDVRWLSDTARNRYILRRVLEVSFSNALSVTDGRRSQKFLDHVLPVFEEQTGTRLCHLAYVTILDVAIRRSRKMEEARHLLEKALFVETQAGEDEDISDTVLQSVAVYWVQHGRGRNERFDDNAEVVLTEARGEGTTTAEARLLAANGSARKQTSFHVMDVKR